MKEERRNRGALRARLAGAALALAAFSGSVDASARDRDPDPWFGRDKLLHFGISAGLGGGGYAASTLVFDARLARVLAGASFSLTLGAGKEVYDLAGGGDPSFRDFTWDVLGTAVGVGLALAVDAALGSADDPEPRPAGTRSMAIRF